MWCNHLVSVVLVAGGARNEHGPLRHLFFTRRRRGRGRGWGKPIVRRQPDQRLRVPLRQEREECTDPPRSHGHPRGHVCVLETKRRQRVKRDGAGGGWGRIL